MVGTAQSAYAKRLGNNSRVPPHLDDICTADAAISGRKRGRRERLLCAGEKEAQVCAQRFAKPRINAPALDIRARTEWYNKTSKTINTLR